MRLFLVVLVILIAAPADAEGWRALKGQEIRDSLAGQVVDYDAAWQDFRGDGRTLYNAGGDSWGTWNVQSDRYCSQWPPNSAWTCYQVDLKADGSAVRFRGASDDVTIGTFRGIK